MPNGIPIISSINSSGNSKKAETACSVPTKLNAATTKGRNERYGNRQVRHVPRRVNHQLNHHFMTLVLRLIPEPELQSE
jgi:hypothetical protein